MGDISAEPSMEEILSSIKRIMAEEGEGPVRSRRPARPTATTSSSMPYDDEGDSILELDDPIVPMPRLAPEPVVAPRPMTIASVPRHEPVAEEADEPVPAPPPPPPPPRPAVSEPDADAVEPLVSDRAATASRQAIDQLTRTLSAAAPAATPAGAPTADASLEGLVREMLRPMLRDWLDSRLPAIVEQHVAAEIARITGSR